ncbi:MAG: hypothetical protein K8R92_04555 [Planctomycetes bacterium]|nr:hypothetical protein [Planctomycetota bacterium]
MSNVQIPGPDHAPAHIGVGVYFLAGPTVVCLAGIGGHFGEKHFDGAGYWVGCYLAGILGAALFGWLFARMFHSSPLYWALGAIGLLIGGHLTWVLFGGKFSDAPVSDSDHLIIALASLAGMLLGFAAARMIIARKSTSRST